MSDLFSLDVPSGTCSQPKDCGIDLIIDPREKDIGHFSVRRLLPFAKRRMVGPWIFFDHLGPVTFSPGEGIDVRPHPHINLATVTYVFEGQILHRDSLGSHQMIEQGAINLMVAGRGISHSERTPPHLRVQQHTLHALQLWLALPSSMEEIDPAFYHYAAESIPEFSLNNVTGRVLLGSAFGVTSPVKIFSPALFAEITLSQNASLAVDVGLKEYAVYVISGNIHINGQVVAPNHMAVAPILKEIKAFDTDARIVLIGGDPLGERHIWWNFVSSRPERIEQAKGDWLEGRFQMVPGDQEFIPLPS